MTETSSTNTGQPRIEPQILAQAVQQWNSGQHEPAKQAIRPYADAGDPIGQLLLAWFLHQQGEPGWREAVQYARGAIEAGIPQAASYVVPNMINDPSLRVQGYELARLASLHGINVIDPVSQVLNYSNSNDLAALAAMIQAPFPWFAPITPQGWASAVESAQHNSVSISELAKDINARAGALSAEMEAIRTRVSAQATNLASFMTQTTNAEASSHFEAEAAASKTEAKSAWKIGVGVVVGAATVSLLPLVAHYFKLFTGKGPDFSQAQLVSIHVTAALALGTLAGVLLTRSRVRDRNRQRNTDLSVALKMMFSYAQQIEDERERQQFISANGRVVLEAYLRQDAPPTEDPQSSGVFAGLVGR
ncbi:hypothetical protein [Nocardioides sp. Kera G14]|uniref:hypothetical protein n=1 Tax=Nocardioides sp. Kera G14 TaxID=2884264 RepID=UPI001D12B7D9|nr:hypothetical protein [Nocardioides sp. Kera G14]UDY22943.1 hypothetical protein LH076_12825 [Nocardioides sp. Kera G14]